MNDRKRSLLAMAGAAPVAQRDALRGLKILIVDDNATNRRILRRQIVAWRMQPGTASSGKEALQLLREAAAQGKPYDIILMDCQMPEMDGFEATHLIRKEEQSPEESYHWKSPVYIVAITADTMRNDRERCLAAGMNDYISKPVQLSDLEAVLERWKSPGRMDQMTARATGEAEIQRGEPTGITPQSLERAECPIDMHRLRDVSGNTPEHLREIIDLYLSEANTLIPRLRMAVQGGKAEEIERLAHRLLGSSANCGMVPLVPPLRELERMGRTHQLHGAERLSDAVSDQFGRIQQLLTGLLSEGDESGWSRLAE